MNRGRMTLRAISREWNDALRRGPPLKLWRFGDLADDFRLRAATPDERLALVGEPPAWIEDPGQTDCNAYWAAGVETLCLEPGMTPPEWTGSPRCYLHRPWFAGSMENLKAILLAESPLPFRRRNLIVSANALARV